MKTERKSQSFTTDEIHILHSLITYALHRKDPQLLIRRPAYRVVAGKIARMAERHALSDAAE
jgi:hypothetical protein